MRVHSLDALILLVVMVGVVTVSILEFGPQDSSAKKDPVSCWSPAHFTRSMVDYTNSYCAGALKRGVVYKFIEDILPGFESEKFTKNDSMIATEEVLRTDQKLSKLLLAETLVALLTFVVQYMVLAFLISKVQGETEDQGYSTDNAEKSATGASQNSGIRGSKALSKSSWVTVIYCLVLLAAAIAWFVMGGISHGAALAKPDPAEIDVQKEVASTGVFICNFNVRRLGNIMRYTVQCMANQMDSFKSSYGQPINTSMCFTIAALFLIHLLYTLFVFPLVNKKVNGRFISDLNLALLVGWF